MNPILDQLVSAEFRLAGPIPDAADAVKALILHSLTVFDDGTFRTGGINRDGTDQSLAEFITDLKTTRPGLFAAPASAANAALPFAPTTRTAQDMATIAAGRSQDVRKANAADVAALGNPWKRGATWNLTRQGIVHNGDPELAERLRAEAAL